LRVLADAPDVGPRERDDDADLHSVQPRPRAKAASPLPVGPLRAEEVVEALDLVVGRREVGAPGRAAAHARAQRSSLAQRPARDAAGAAGGVGEAAGGAPAAVPVRVL